MIDDMFFVERGALEHMSTYICVEREALEHMKRELEVLGISPKSFHVDVGNKLWNMGSFAIVSLGVSYKCILSLVLSEELWNSTKL